MEWTRSPLMRAVALAASVGLVVIHWDTRGPWFWVGVALVALNVAGLAARSRTGPPAEPEEGGSYRLADLLFVPGVAAALAAGPEVWRQVSYLDDPIEPMPVRELAAYVWVGHDADWSIGLGDELKPHLDLDLDEAEDPIIGVLLAHPAVADAFHEDREVYRVETRRRISTEEFAELAARALVSHHVHVAARAS